MAEKLGYAYYDQELILKVAKESGLAEQIVEKYDEYATHKNSLLYALALSAGAGAGGTLSFVSKVQQAQAKIITDLADKGACVIVGRGGDYVLRDRADALHVFIHADMEFRARRVVERLRRQRPEAGAAPARQGRAPQALLPLLHHARMGRRAQLRCVP